MKKILFILMLASCAMLNSQQIIDRKYYVTSFDCEHGIPYWSAYILDKNKLIQNTRRYPSFFSDNELKCHQAINKDYSREGWDKGHLAPADDFRYSQAAEKSVFYLTNIAPQFPSFNRAQWEHLEVSVRKLAQQYDSLLVITGVAFNSYQKFIGNNIYVPDYYFKAVYIYKTHEIICYKAQNKETTGDYLQFKCPIDSIRAYISNLPDSLNIFKYTK